MLMESYVTNLFIKIIMLNFYLNQAFGVEILIFTNGKVQLILKPVTVFLCIKYHLKFLILENLAPFKSQ